MKCWYWGPDGVVVQWLNEAMEESGNMGSDQLSGYLGGGWDINPYAGLL